VTATGAHRAGRGRTSQTNTAAATGHGLRFNLNDYVLFWPGVLVALVVAVAASAWLGRAIQRPRVTAFGLTFSIGVVVAATLTPGRDALLYGIPGGGACDLSTFALPTIAQLTRLNETSLNVFLFVPLGFTIGLVAGSRRTWPQLVASLALPVAIEGIQLVVTPLGRSCQAVDIVDNVSGLLIGLALAGLAWAAARLSASPD
jgi:hypothetical protein